jgi:membrane fusion protein (multidrug efflux system)
MRKRLVLPTVLMLGAVAVVGWYWWTTLRFLETTNNAYVDGDLATVSPRVAGYVANVELAENHPVREGDVLVRLVDREYRARADQAAALLQAREAAMAMVDSQLGVQRLRIREAEAQLASAMAQLARAKADFDRYDRLVRRRNASVQALDAARAEAGRAEAAVTAAEASLAATQEQVLVLENQSRTARAEHAMAQAALDLARSDLDNTVIRAPIDGVIGNRSVQLGDYTKAGEQLMVIVPIDRLYVEANFKETQLRRMRVGSPVSIEVDAFPDVALEGTVESLAPASGSTFSLLPPENATGNYTKIVQRVPVRIALPAGNALAGQLRPGLSVVVTADVRRSGEGGLASPIGSAAAAVIDAGR